MGQFLNYAETESQKQKQKVWDKQYRTEKRNRGNNYDETKFKKGNKLENKLNNNNAG